MYTYFYQNGQGHPNCFDNINQRLQELGVAPFYDLQPFNIFMHTSITPDKKVTVEVPLSQPGDCLSLQAQMDSLVSVSACSVNESTCNNGNCTAVKVIIHGAERSAEEL